MDKIKIEDKSRIENITFLYPELMNENAEAKFKEVYESMMIILSSLQEAREKVLDLEKKYKEASEYWNSIKHLCKYSHPCIYKDDIIKECGWSIRGHGNAIIGKTSII